MHTRTPPGPSRRPSWRTLGRSAALACVAAGLLLALHAAHARERGDRYRRSESDSAEVGPAAVDDGLRVFFSPKGGCEEAIVEALHDARRSIDFQAYSFTSTKIADALADAHRRGVKVRAVLDRTETNEHYSAAATLARNGVPTWTDGEHPIAHNKVIVIDGETVLTGSFNFTHQAENSNAENLLVIEGKRKLTAAYEGNFEHHLGHSKRCTPPQR